MKHWTEHQFSPCEHVELTRICDILERRYVFTLLRAEALCSLIALVAKLIKMSLSKVHISDIEVRCAGDSEVT